MSVNQQWVIREKEKSEPAAVAVRICPYFKKTCSVASYSADGKCLAGGLSSRFCTAQDMREFCQQDYQQCPLYKVVAAGGKWEPPKEDDWGWPSF